MQTKQHDMDAYYSHQKQQMQTEGTTEYNILHIPMQVREKFITIIEDSHHPQTIVFWRQNWANRDAFARKLLPPLRQEFLEKCCSTEMDRVFWTALWKDIDQQATLIQRRLT
jgi:hypothetical protein